MKPNRIGKVTEYKRGHYYLSHTEWEDGHCEIEIHHCVPKIIWHSCDTKELDTAKQIFQDINIRDEPPPCLPEAQRMVKNG